MARTLSSTPGRRPGIERAGRAISLQINTLALRAKAGPTTRASQFHQAFGLQVVRRTHQLPAAGPTGRRGRPNGCGKSNIMDAVRWVLGESRASELRGESMQDVIFNGTTTRKQASRSSVELVFDNADHRAGGQWSQFAEIAVRARARPATATQQLLHQQPAGAPPRRAGRVPGHRPRPARLRHHRPGHDQPDHRIQARGTAPVPRRSRRRLRVQGAPPRDREPPGRHAREPHAGRRHPARTQRQPRRAREAGRGGARYNTLQGDADAQAAPAVVPEAQRERGRPGQDQGRRRQGDQRPRIAHGRPAPHRGRARDRAPGALRGRRPGQPGAGQALRGQRRSRPARRRDPLRGRRPPARRAAPGAAARADRASGAAAATTPRPRSRPWPAQGVDAEEQAELLAAQLEEHDARMPDLEEAAAARPGRGQRPARERVAGAAADPGAGRRPAQHRRAEPPAHACAANACAPTRTRWPRPTKRACSTCRSSSPRRRKPPAEAEARLHELQEAVPQLDDDRRTQAAGRQHRGRPPRRAARPGWKRCKRAAGKGQDRRQARALARQAWPRRPAGPVEPHPHRAGLGKRARSRTARTPGRARSQPPGHGPRLRQRCAARQAGLLQPAGRRSTPKARPRCRACPTCCA